MDGRYHQQQALSKNFRGPASQRGSALGSLALRATRYAIPFVCEIVYNLRNELEKSLLQTCCQKPWMLLKVRRVLKERQKEQQLHQQKKKQIDGGAVKKGKRPISKKPTSRISRSSKPKKIPQKPTKRKTDSFRNTPH